MISGVPGFGRKPETDEYGNPIEPSDTLSVGEGGSAPATPAAPAAPMVGIVQPPDLTIRRESSTTGPRDTREEVIRSPGATAAVEGIAEAEQRQRDAQTRVNAANDLAAMNAAVDKAAEVDQARREEAAAAALEERRQQAVAAKMAAQDQRESEYKAALDAGEKDYWADKGAGARILSGFLVGLSRGFGTGAFAESMDREIERDRQIKTQKIERAARALERATGNVTAAQSFYDDEVKRMNAQHVAQRDKETKRMAAFAAKLKIPGAAAEAEKAQAAEAAKQQQARYEREKELNVKTTHTDAVTTTSGGSTQNFSAGQGANKAPNLAERQAAAAAASQRENMERVDKILKDDPGAWKNVQQALLTQRKLEEANKGISSPFVGAGKALGYVPVAPEQMLKTKNERDLFSALAPVMTQKAREIDPQGALSETSIQAGKDYSALLTRSAEEMRAAVGVYRDRAAREEAAALPGRPANDNGGTIYLDENSRPKKEPPTEKLPRGDKAKILQAELKRDPNGPRAGEIRAALRELAADESKEITRGRRRR